MIIKAFIIWIGIHKKRWSTKFFRKLFNLEVKLLFKLLLFFFFWFLFFHHLLKIFCSLFCLLYRNFNFLILDLLLVIFFNILSMKLIFIQFYFLRARQLHKTLLMVFQNVVEIQNIFKHVVNTFYVGIFMKNLFIWRINLVKIVYIFTSFSL
jgi:hypothetical protein